MLRRSSIPESVTYGAFTKNVCFAVDILSVKKKKLFETPPEGHDRSDRRLTVHTA
ncbi:MAG TPA: hypothetical protein VGO47_00670 [Chlamydiales bacterium]|nr:hypothetical protein [Chlamydiales bacterium]